MERGYQYGFSSRGTAMFNVEERERKARTMLAVLQDHVHGRHLGEMSMLTVGGSAGVLDNFLADHMRSVTSIDIDAPAVEYARQHYAKGNLKFLVGDAMDLDFKDASFDIVICSQVYEHVTSAEKMMDEVWRVLKAGGVCYFAANNRLMWNEPHYDLPLLSVLPRFLAHRYIRLAGRASHYHEKHYTYWGLLRLVRRFTLHDYTARIARDPRAYGADYMIRPGSMKAAAAIFLSGYVRWLMPGYIWLLEKPA